MKINPSENVKKRRADALLFFGARDGTRLHFHMCENSCSHQCLHWWQQYATGILHTDHSSSIPTKN